MKKKMRILVAVLTIVTMIGTLCACGSASADEEFTGELIDARGQSLVVRGDTSTMMFTTSDGTQFTYVNENELTIGDELKVKYHEQSGTFYASSVDVTNHSEQLLVLGGKITELKSDSITIQSESMTVKFSRDDETQVQGSPSKGDIVAVTYKGDISESAYAVSIVVTQNNRAEALTTMNGSVSEVANHSVLVSVDSSDAYRFTINDDTIINGDDKKLKVGDRVKLVYTGELGKEPVARTITITRNEDQKYFVLDGVIDTVTSKNIKVRTAKKTYTIKFAEQTRVENKKYLAKGHRTTITYTGSLDKDPVAVVIYCSKEKITPKETKKTETKKKETKKSETKKSETKKSETKKSETKKSETKKSETQKTETQEPVTKETETQTQETETQETETQETETQETETQETETQETETQEPVTEETETQEPETEATEPPAPEDDMVIVKATGTIYEMDSSKRTATFKLEGGGQIELDVTDSAIPSGYLPQLGDDVAISYDKSDMKLLDIQLVYRPGDEG